jgi:hypothetical protein
MRSTALTRRTLVQTAALTTATAPFVRGAYAAGKLAVGFWDHWAPGANDMLTKLCREWASREKVEISIDFITSQGRWRCATLLRSPNSAGPILHRRGPKGRFDPGNPNFWAIWGFSTNKAAAKSLLRHLSQRSSAEQLVAASHGKRHGKDDQGRRNQP